MAKKKPIIEVCERAYDHHFIPLIVDREFKGMVEAPKYHAQVVGSKAWGCGDSPAAAIGDLVMTNPGMFGMAQGYIYLGKQGR